MAEKLESVIRRHEKQRMTLDVQAVHDLRAAGFTTILTIEDAYTRFDAQRRHPGFDQLQIDIVMHQEARTKKRKNAA